MILTSNKQLCIYHDYELCYNTPESTKIADGCINGDLLMYCIDESNDIIIYNYNVKNIISCRSSPHKPSKLLIFNGIISICSNNFIYLKTKEAEHRIIPQTIRNVVDYFVTNHNLMILTTKGVEMWEISKSSRLLTVFGFSDILETPKSISYISDISIGVMFNSGKVELINTPDEDAASVDSLSIDLQDFADEDCNDCIDGLLSVSISNSIK
jgi:hypothetical protein